MSSMETFSWGFLGSAAVELVALTGLYANIDRRFPSRYRRAGFWIARTALAVVAGLLAVAYAIDTRLLAFNVGAATPLIVTFLVRELKPVMPGRRSRAITGSRVEIRDSSPPAPWASRQS